MWSLFAVAALSQAVPALAETAPASESEIAVSEADQAAVELALNRGLRLYRYDQAAWHVTDALMEDVADPGASGARGWVVSETDNGLLVTFWKHAGEGYAGFYSAQYDGKSVTDRQLLEGDAIRLSDLQIKLIEAGQVVRSSEPEMQRCSNAPFNTVILPEGGPADPILVYYLVPQTSTDVVPMGGHYRFGVLDGAVISSRKFMNSCFDFPLRAESGNRPGAMFITHLLDRVPTELHVFSVFAAGLSIVVMTADNDLVWAVEVSEGQPRISLIDTLSTDQ